MAAGAGPITDLIVETFRLNGTLLAAGDRLVADIGLTSARWQVMGAIAMSAIPLSVAQTARNMGLSRQAVQRIANALSAEDLVAFLPNPHHARARLVVLTKKGNRTFETAIGRQRPWALTLASGLSEREITTAVTVLKAVRNRLEPPSAIERTASWP
ncbi:MAG: MarR family winged helix-turn-helix transcriptional regulator [Alphaproteobacteria bacterium]